MKKRLNSFRKKELSRELFSDKYWPHRAILFAVFVLVIYFWFWPATPTLKDRVLKETFLFIFLPYLFLKLNGKHLSKVKINRRTLKNTLILLLLMLPFYVIAASIPQVREYYPIWSHGAGILGFLGMQGKQTVISIATETFYRGLLCVWIRGIGPKSILVSPVVYAAAHIGKPTVEVIGSGPADVVFGFFDYRSESIIPSVVTHSVGMATVDWLCSHPALFPELGRIIENLI